MRNPDVCNCCGEIWNRDNLNSISFGKNAMHLCPDCFAEYENIIFSAFEAGFRKGKFSAANGKSTIKNAFKQWNRG